MQRRRTLCASAATGTAMDIRDAIYQRRAVRAYSDEAVDETTLRELIDAAVQAPSAMNSQAWTFCIVRDRSMLADIATRAREFMLANTPAGLLSHHANTVLHGAGFDIFYGAPALVLICSTTEHPWAVENCALDGGKPHAGRTRRRPRHLLDRFRASVVAQCRRQGVPAPAAVRAPGRADRRRSSGNDHRGSATPACRSALGRAGTPRTRCCRLAGC